VKSSTKLGGLAGGQPKIWGPWPTQLPLRTATVCDQLASVASRQQIRLCPINVNYSLAIFQFETAVFNRQ